MNWAEIIVLVLSGVLVGFINTLAGGGTIITVSLLLFLGLPAGTANGTNRIAVIFQTLVSVIGFHRKKLLDWKNGLIYSVPTVAGSVVGAFVAVQAGDGILEKAFAVVMLLMLFFILYKPERWLKGKESLHTGRISSLQLILFFLTGFYGGFIHIGVGFFLIAGLVLAAGYDLIRANAIKNLMVLAYSPFALLVFIYEDQVDYRLGLILSIGNITGAWLATRFAVKWGSGFVRWVMVVFILITVVQLFGWLDLPSLFNAFL
jgi:uncharacterized protein